MKMPERLKRLNRIRVKDADLDFFKEFFRENYKGEPMPQCFKEIVIEITEVKSGKVELYVDYRDRNRVLIDCYTEGIRVVTVFIDESEEAIKDNESGRYLTITATKVDEEIAIAAGGKIPKGFTEEFSMYASDIFNYVFLYYSIMKGTIIKREETVNLHKRRSSGKKAKKKQESRRIVYIPQCIKHIEKVISKDTVVAEETKTAVVGEKNRQEARYIKEQWERKGTTYYNKKGTLVVRAPSKCHRRKPLAEEGIDIVIRPSQKKD